MDIEKALQELRRLCAQIDHELGQDGYDAEMVAALASELVDHVRSVDDWLTRGEYPPKDWS